MKLWWTVWGGLVKTLLTLFASVASLMGLVLVLLPKAEPPTGWSIVLISSFALFLALLVVMEVRAYQRSMVFLRSDSRGIRNYMHQWIRQDGRIAIWTRDMSWAEDDKIRKLLEEKSSKNELIICLPTGTQLTNDLAACGAEICAYGPEFEPLSRFTIAHYGRDGQRVAVGRGEGHNHIIEEFHAGKHPAFFMAKDLIDVARNLK